MTYEWCNRKMFEFSRAVWKFDPEAEKIDPDLALCYQTGYSKLTISLFYRSNKFLPSTTVSKSHIDLLCACPITPEVHALADKLNEFVQRN